jgi:chromate reductase, NAD(P)H dehydrogenase (quinone)
MSDSKPAILAFAGSTRTDSYNNKLVRGAARGAIQAGSQVMVIDLRDFQMPIYDGDIKMRSGIPQH